MSKPIKPVVEYSRIRTVSRLRTVLLKQIPGGPVSQPHLVADVLETAARDVLPGRLVRVVIEEPDRMMVDRAALAGAAR
jgi:hypothetical protein